MKHCRPPKGPGVGLERELGGTMCSTYSWRLAMALVGLQVDHDPSHW